MPHYYLRLQDGSLSLTDPEGFHAIDLTHAISEARKSARWIIKDDLQSGRVRLDRYFIITDEAGNSLASINFNDQALK